MTGTDELLPAHPSRGFARNIEQEVWPRIERLELTTRNCAERIIPARISICPRSLRDSARTWEHLAQVIAVFAHGITAAGAMVTSMWEHF
jgi:hypothetical protein